MIVYADKYKNPLIQDTPSEGMDVHTPWEIENIDYIYQQIQYRHRLLLEANGESCQIWRRKTGGIRCTNPNCAAYDNYRQEANADCPKCFGTGWVDGWDYQGETLVRIAPQGMMFKIAEGGLMKVHEPRSWTFVAPKIDTRDILIAFDRDQLIQEKTTVDEQLARRIDRHADFDGLSKAGVTKILKISDEANKPASYQYNVDYILTNDGVQWQTPHRPDPMARYFVTYQASTSHYRRFEASNITTPHWRAQPMHQEMDLMELDVTHPAYNILMREPDWTRRYYPFPISDWFSRTY